MRPPRQAVHRGSVEASGVFLSPNGGEATLRERALSLWTPGAEIHRLAGGLAVLFPTPRRMLTRESPGAPLVRRGTWLCSAPLANDELEVLAAPPGSVVLVHGGKAWALPHGAATLEDPARWLDLASFEGASVQGLGPAPEPVPEALQPLKLALRQRASVPAESPDAAEVAEALRVALAKGLQPPPARGFRAFTGRVMRALARFLAGPGTAVAKPPGVVASAGPGQLVRSSTVPAPPPPPTWQSRLADWLNRAAMKAAMASGLARILGARQAEYFNRMMRFFEDGDLEQALRHAIPLGGEGGGPARAALGVPKPREDLSIPLGPRSPGAAIGLGGDLMEELRALYRRTFQRLERAGEIERAAFVLAELLRAHEEAVLFLERHGRLRLAAELAESRGLPAGLVVRQWFLADDVERALLVARRTGAFADAMLRLNRTHPDRARSFALVWAGALAEAGNYWQAADVVWTIPGAMSLALGWLDRAIEVGGSTGARALVRRLSADAEVFGEIRPRALALLQAPLEEDGGARFAFADELKGLAEKTKQAVLSPPLAALARGTVRALARDAGEGAGWVTRQELERLARIAGEPAVEADLPPLPPVRPRLGGLLVHRAGVPGQRRVYDVALLPGGRVLAALGESGAEVCTRDGRRVHLFDVPAHSVVVSDHGDRAIAVAPRGDLKLLSRLDLRTGQAQRWCEAPLRAFAKDYDGDVWFASEVGALLAVDARADGLRALWRLPQLPGGVLGIARNRAQCHVLVQPDWGMGERWTLELPSLTLRARTELEGGAKGTMSLFAVAPDGTVACADYPGLLAATGQPLEAVAQHLRVFRTREFQRSIEIGSLAANRPPSAGNGFAAAVSPTPGSVQVTVADTAQLAVVARVELPGAHLAAVRFTGEAVAIADDAGRVLALDLARGRLTHELRR
ncbi:MAG TPA: bpX6 domain-containing protein [Myxococcaceae bacterium]|jgi:hypothetical protein